MVFWLTFPLRSIKSRDIDLRLSHLLLPPHGIQWSAGLAAPRAPPAGCVGWTPCRSEGRSSAWRPEPPALTGTASSVCWGHGQSLHLQAERTSSDWNSLKNKNNIVNVWDICDDSVMSFSSWWTVHAPRPSRGKYSSRMLVQKLVRFSSDFRCCCSFPLGSLGLRMGAKWPNT